MSIPRLSQLANVSVINENAKPAVSQLAIIAVTGPPSTPVLMSQLAIVSVAMNNEKLVSLGDPIGLECWQPCTSYGTRSLIFYIGA